MLATQIIRMKSRKLALVITLLTFSLILLGGIVHGTDSSLACPDWPLCYGTLFPEMKGNIAVEHGHRLLAAMVGLLTIILAVFLRKEFPENRGLHRLGLAALFLVIFQGVLGGITVLYKLSDLVSTAHLGMSMIFFSTLLLIVLTLRSPKSFSEARKGTPPSTQFIKLMIALLFLQILLGAFVRHSGSGLLCPDIPMCYGSWWPIDSWGRQIHMLHRLMAVVLLLLSIPLPFLYWKISDDLTKAVLSAIPLLLLSQTALGILSIQMLLGLIPLTAHLAIAVLLLGSLMTAHERLR